MRLWVLGSGSKGNAVLIESGSTRVLVDAGFGVRTLAQRLARTGVRPESISACVITHEHSDHTRGAFRAARRWGWALHATAGTAANSAALRSATVCTFAAGHRFSVGEMEITTHAAPHDAAEPIAVVATSTRTGERAAVCTDIGHASDGVRAACADVDILVIESNHDEIMLANGPYPRWLQRRIASDTGHLSNRACGVLVRDAVTRRLGTLVLAHLSEINNTPRTALAAIRPVLRQSGFIGRLAAARQDAVLGPVGRLSGGRQLELGL